MTGWQPIETAPKDVDVIVFLPGASVSIRVAMLCPKFSGQDGFSWLDTGCNRLTMFPPSHWMRLPEPPMSLDHANNQPTPDDFPPEVKAQVDELSDDQRLDLFSHYCQSCGRKDPACQCWNDE